MASVNDVLQRQVITATRHEEETSLHHRSTTVSPTPAAAVVGSDLPWASIGYVRASAGEDEEVEEPTPPVPSDAIPPMSSEQEDPAMISNIEEPPLYDEDSEDDNNDDRVNPIDPVDHDFEEQSDDDSIRAQVSSRRRQGHDGHESDNMATLETTEQQHQRLLFSENNLRYNRQELRNLATLLDRLGRTLTDAAPHIALLAENLPSEAVESRHDPEDDETTDHDAVDDALEEIAESFRDDLDAHTGDTPIRGLLSLWSRERRNRSQGTSLLRSLSSSSSSRPTRRGGRAGPSQSTAPLVDPDHEDYVSGLVNTTRGEVRTGPRSRTSNDDVANLLGAYLAAATMGNGGSLGDSNREDGSSGGLGQLLRGGAVGGGGIDIHIHAVVTGPGGTFGTGTGNAATLLGGTAVGGPRNIFSTNRRTSINNNTNNSGSSVTRNRSRSGSFASIRRRVTPPEDGDAGGIFDELYSETPEPIDPNGSTENNNDHSSSPMNNNSIRTRSLQDAEDSDNNSAGDYITGLNASYLADENFSTNFEPEPDAIDDYRTTPRSRPVNALDYTNVGAATMAGRGIVASAARRRRTSRGGSSRRATTLEDPSESESPRHRLTRSLSRLFRRRSSRADEPNG
jgi:hypothetical protein